MVDFCLVFIQQTQRLGFCNYQRQKERVGKLATLECKLFNSIYDYVVFLADMHLLREINLDKVRSWKPFSRSKHTRGLGFHLPLEKKPEDPKHNINSRQLGSESGRLGFEVYAEGTVRVLRICEFSDSHKVNVMFRSSRKMRLRISYFSVHLLEHLKQVRFPL